MLSKCAFRLSGGLWRFWSPLVQYAKKVHIACKSDWQWYVVLSIQLFNNNIKMQWIPTWKHLYYDGHFSLSFCISEFKLILLFLEGIKPDVILSWFLTFVLWVAFSSSMLEERVFLLCHCFSWHSISMTQHFLFPWTSAGDCIAFSTLCWETTLQ